MRLIIILLLLSACGKSKDDGLFDVVDDVLFGERDPFGFPDPETAATTPPPALVVPAKSLAFYNCEGKNDMASLRVYIQVLADETFLYSTRIDYVAGGYYDQFQSNSQFAPIESKTRRLFRLPSTDQWSFVITGEPRYPEAISLQALSADLGFPLAVCAEVKTNF